MIKNIYTKLLILISCTTVEARNKNDEHTLILLFFVSLVICFYIFVCCSISQATGAESQARIERIQEIESELENMSHHISTLGQQIEQYQHACNRTREEQARMR